jgi:hypothetical protein
MLARLMKFCVRLGVRFVARDDAPVEFDTIMENA